MNSIGLVQVGRVHAHMWVLFAGVYLEFLEHNASEAALWKHASHGFFDEKFWLAITEIAVGLCTLTTWVAGVGQTEFLLGLAA